MIGPQWPAPARATMGSTCVAKVCWSVSEASWFDAAERWADVAEGSARVTHLTRPRDLDPELGPER